MKTWAYWDKAIMAELKKIPSPHVADAPMFQDRPTRIAVIKRNSKKVDDICASFIASGQWPFLTMEEAFCVERRLGNAYELVNSLLCAQGAKCDVVVRPPDLTVTPIDKVWRFLLFDWWHTNEAKYIAPIPSEH